ncbi:MAG: SYNERG-CTERM sorting domain-containing protein [Oscillospiraceae bacterium]|nr:SYNERG-CTERM sorting domain-containing protein [Oscillospiraceae bacterium]
MTCLDFIAYQWLLSNPGNGEEGGAGSGGGCDTGFGAYALLVLTGAAVLRKKMF